MLVTSLLLSGLDYNAVGRSQTIKSNFSNPYLVEEVVSYKGIDDFLEAKNSYLLDFNSISDIYQTISLKLKDEFEKNSISADVYKTSYDLISLLPESILFRLREDNVYPTNYGTVVLDWEDDNSNDEFSLEIGNSCFGYFSERDGKDMINVEEVDFNSQEVSNLHKRIEEFYQG